MHLSEFHVLLVDDEPDVHEVSRLAMRHFKVYGLPIRLHSARSKAEAIEVLNSLTLGRSDINMASVALIDVMMETDRAGLELCEHIREQMNNGKLQIYLRTGQPGIAPERAVLDRYDVQGYLAKGEDTEDKLYTVVKAGIRQSLYIGLSHALQDLIHYLIPSAASRQQIAESLRNWQRVARVDARGEKAPTIGSSLCYIVEDRFVVGLGDWQEEAVALERRNQLAALPATSINSDGDQYTLDGRDLLIQIAPNQTNAGVHYLLRGTVASPDWEVFLYHRYLRSFAALWKQAARE
ncbi:MAG: response regulator receiver protein [Vulcanimicrobiota bacterium]